VNLATQHAWALTFGAGVGVLGVGIGAALRGLLQGSGRRGRSLAWIALLAPYFTPTLLVGYAYSSFSLCLVGHPFWNRLLYGVLVLMKFVPIAALVLHFAPSPLSPQAVHCRRLLRRGRPGLRSAGSYLLFLARGPGRGWGVAFALVFVFAFGEFELASLMAIRTWSVSLFDAHAGGLALSGSLRLMAFALALEAGLLLAVIFMLRGSGGVAAAGAQRRPPAGGGRRLPAWAYLSAAALAVTVLPCAIVIRGTARGLLAVARDFVLGEDIAASLLLAGGSAFCAYLVAGWCAAPAMASRSGRGGALMRAFAFAVPGLLGPLVLSLLMVFLFQALGLRALYDSPAPLVLTLTLVVLPFAVLLRILLGRLRGGQALHAAQLLRSSLSGGVRRWRRRLVWQLRWRAEFWVVFLLFCWGYFDLTASAILAPPGMTPVTVRLYNLMHYGQTQVLSAMVCVAFAVPVLALLVAYGVRGLSWRLAAHV